MVFSSIPAYLDPANWQQQPNHNSGPSSGASTQFAPPPQHHGSGGAGSIRPGSMADRARMANISMPEAALKCPRCESSNTKFCYFNNYSLSQPRHFCKTCRRYWTRGGALRNVPVGGGCRRNKRSKESSSSNNKSPVNSSTDHRQMAASGNSTSTMSSTNSGASDHIFGLGPQIPPLTFMTSFNHHLTADEFACGADIGLNYGSLSAPVVGATANDHFNFHIASALASGGTYGGGGGGSFLSSLSGLDQWRLQQAHQQFPFLDSTSSSSPLGLYGVDASGYNGAGQVRPKISSQLAAAASVKMEESRRHHHHHQQQQQQQQQIQEMNFSRQFMGIQGNDQYWNTNTGGATAAPWTDISTFNSSSTGNPL